MDDGAWGPNSTQFNRGDLNASFLVAESRCSRGPVVASAPAFGLQLENASFVGHETVAGRALTCPDSSPILALTLPMEALTARTTAVWKVPCFRLALALALALALSLALALTLALALALALAGTCPRC